MNGLLVLRQGGNFECGKLQDSVMTTRRRRSLEEEKEGNKMTTNAQCRDTRDRAAREEVSVGKEMQVQPRQPTDVTGRSSSESVSDSLRRYWDDCNPPDDEAKVNRLNGSD